MFALPSLGTFRFPTQLTENVTALGLAEMEFTGLCFALVVRKVLITHQLHLEVVHRIEVGILIAA